MTANQPQNRLIKTPSKQSKKQPKKQSSLWVETLQTVGLSMIMAFGIRQFVAEARVVPTGSMQPTSEINDRLFVE